MFYVADYVLAYRLSNFSCTVLTVDGCVSINHRLRGSASPVVKVTSHFNGKLQNLTPRISQTP